MTQVGIVETPGGDQPLAKAEGDVLGWETQLAEAQAYAVVSADRVERVKAEAAERIAAAKTNADRAKEEVARCETELAAAHDAIPAARAAQAAYDALPQAEKDRLEADKQLVRLRAAADAAQADLANAEAAAAPQEG